MLNDKTLEKILWACAVLLASIPLVTAWVNVWQPIPDDVGSALVISWVVLWGCGTAAFLSRFG